MNWAKAIAYCASFKDEYKPVYDKNGQPHWIELDCTREIIEGVLVYAPNLCSESDVPFSPDFEPYTKNKKHVWSGAGYVCKNCGQIKDTAGPKYCQ